MATSFKYLHNTTISREDIVAVTEGRRLVVPTGSVFPHQTIKPSVSQLDNSSKEEIDKFLESFFEG
ncbi:MAG: hypothetical protein LBV04_09165 [Deferribacteraceae bacterium]|jgi:hypothetical protein|nr:hypothetical protein [Deferribacteraceae bacterium]